MEWIILISFAFGALFGFGLIIFSFTEREPLAFFGGVLLLTFATSIVVFGELYCMASTGKIHYEICPNPDGTSGWKMVDGPSPTTQPTTKSSAE